MPLTTNAIPAPSLPHEQTFRRGSLIFHSDAEVSPNHPLFLELASFPEQVCRTLELRVTDQPIHIYLFKDRVSYEHYIQVEFKDIPSRRALFVMRPAAPPQKQDTLEVHAFWGDRVQDDLRHELTHATLHGVLQNVPLWLDEGLAMYFEVGVAAEGKHQRVLSALEPAIKDGVWKFDINRLMDLKEVSQMGLADYHEAWAWVYCLMHASPAYRTMLFDYLRILKDRVRKDSPPAQMNLTNASLPLEQQMKKLLAERHDWPHGKGS